MDEKTLRIDIAFATIVKSVLFLILLYCLYLLRDLTLVVLMAIVIASGIEPGVRWFKKYRIPRIIAVIIMYGFIFGLFAVMTLFFLPPLIEELKLLSINVPASITGADIVHQATDSVSEIADGILPGGLGARIIDSLAIGEALNQVVGFADQYKGGFFKVASAVFGGALSSILIVVISFYLSVQEKGIEKFLRIVVPLAHEDYVINLWERSQAKIGLWVKGQLVLALFVGILVYLTLTIIGIPYAFILAVLAAVFELIPIFGPILSAIPAIIIGFLTGGLGSVFLVTIVYIIIQQIENQLLYPLVVRQVVGVSPIIAIIALVAGGELAGFLGILLAVPLSAAALEFFDDLDKKKKRPQVTPA
jgi:predicted PurR-regulated permease PerM